MADEHGSGTTFTEGFVARSPTIFRRETPRKSLHCRFGFHWWSSLDWHGSVPVSFLDRRRVERHCLHCGKIETYLLEAD